jgi:hypothetical protein
MKKLLLLIIYCLTLNVNAQTKRALIVAVGDYPTEKTGWTKISSLEDYKIIRKMLLNQEFKKENIDSLLNEDATAEGLDQKFSELLSKCEKGDMIYFHFSGHGQQVTDIEQNINSISDNELDGYDESLVMFDAPKKCEDYDMSKHYIDDKLNYWITEIRKKIVDGHVVMVLDACHSGTASRGTSDNHNIIRGTRAICGDASRFNRKEENINGLEFEFKEGDNIGELVVFSGCKAEEVNMEYKTEDGVGFGSLSYAFVRGVEKLSKSEATYYDLYGFINEFIQTSVNKNGGYRQHPQIEEEGKSLKIFNGDFIPADATYSIQKYKNEKAAINAGSINSNIKVGDKVEFRPIRVEDGIKIIGEVKKVDLFSSVVYVEIPPLSKRFTFNQRNNFKDMFECTLPYSSPCGDAKLKINVDVKSSKDKSKIHKFLKDNPSFEYSKNANYIITDSADAHVIKIRSTDVVVQNMRPDDYTSEYFISVLKDLSAIEIAKNQNFDSPEINIDFGFEKPEYQVGDDVSIIFNNTGTKDVFFYFFEINPLMKMDKLKEGELKSQDKLVLNGSIIAPYGTYTYLLISSDYPLNLTCLNQLVQNSKSRSLNKEPQVDWKRYVYTVVK